jgi:polysaccharide pyruvyl transferase WcaK-like protein
LLIELKGGQFANAGAHLMLRESIAQIRSRCDEIDFAMYPNRLASSADRRVYRLKTLIPLRKGSLDCVPLAYRAPTIVSSMLSKCGAAIEPQLSAVLDLSGFAYGVKWGDYSMRRAAAEIARFSRAGKPYVFLPQAFGPFSPTRGSREFAAALRDAALVCARDRISEGYLVELTRGGLPAIKLVPDLTIACRRPALPAGTLAIDRRAAILVPNSRVPASKLVGVSQYLDLMVGLATALAANGYQVWVLNHAGREDDAISRQLLTLLARCGVRANCLIERDPVLIRESLGVAGLVVASRFHACIAALSQGVPCVATSWSHKYQELFSDFGCSDSVIGCFEPDEAQRALNYVLENRQQISTTSQHVAVAAARDVAAMWDQVAGLIKESR